ncbi:30S ribosomal protein S17 [Candidatus Vidania fulgoroideorum]
MYLTGKIIRISSKKTVSALIRKKKKNNKYKTFSYKDKKVLAHYNCMYLKLGMKIILKYYKKVSKKKSWKIFKILK